MSGAVEWYWTFAGIIGGCIFYGRFVLQWWASERRGESVVPPAFWYISLLGALLLLIYGVRIQSPLATLGYNLNLFIYARNIALIWRKRGWLQGASNIVFHIVFGAIAISALAAMTFTWSREIELSRDMPAEIAQTNWFWLGLGLLGQALFAGRMIVQWLVSERARESTVPTIFWYMSAVAAALQCAAYAQRYEWVFVAGMVLTFTIYIRNLWLIHRAQRALSRHSA